MILKELRLSHFGKFREKEITLKPGLNIIYGKNEAGKTTLHSFIRGMLFGIEAKRGRSSKDDIYIRYLPWNHGARYDGMIDLIEGNRELRIKRSFYKQNKEFQVTDLATGKPVVLPHKEIGDLIPGLTESLYRNTVSIEQLRVGPDEELAREVCNYITNLSVSKTNEVDVSNALGQLNQRRKEIIVELGQYDCEKLKDSYALKQKQLELVDQLNEELLVLEQSEKEFRELRDQLIGNEEKMRDLHGNTIFEEMRPKFQEYAVLQEKCKQTNEEYKNLTKAINDLLRVENSHKTIYQDIEDINQIHEQVGKIQEEINAIRHQETILVEKQKKRTRFWNTLPVLLIIIISCILLGKKGITIAVAAAFLGVIVYLYKQYRLTDVLGKLEEQELSLDRECMELEAKKREIFLQDHVTDDGELRYKVRLLRENQQELFEDKDKRKEIEKEQIRIYSQLEQITKEINRYARNYFKEFTIGDELLSDIEYEVNLRKEAVAKEKKELEEQYDEVVAKLERKRWERKNYDNLEEELMAAKRHYLQADEMKEKLGKELAAVNLAISSIEELSIGIHDSFGSQINEHLSKIVEKVTNGKYTDVKMDENLNVRVLMDHEYVSFEKLSAGAIAEIYLALRITVANILNGTKRLPLIFDDAFVLYDDDRLTSTLQELSNRSGRQIIIFTCHHREQEILKRLNLEYNYVDLSQDRLEDEGRR